MFKQINQQTNNHEPNELNRIKAEETTTGEKSAPQISEQTLSKGEAPCRLLDLFWVFFKIGLFTFGGGLVMLPLIQRTVVYKKRWMKDEEFVEMLALINSLPGAFSINTSIFIGFRKRGITGAVVASLGTMLPSFCIILIIAWLLLQGQEMEWLNKFFLGVRPVVVAMLIDAGIKFWQSSIKQISDIVLVIIGTAAVALTGINAALVILAGAVIGIIWYRRKLQDEQQEVAK